jgi:hypothetical protein
MRAGQPFVHRRIPAPPYARQLAANRDRDNGLVLLLPCLRRLLADPAVKSSRTRCNGGRRSTVCLGPGPSPPLARFTPPWPRLRRR